MEKAAVRALGLQLTGAPAGFSSSVEAILSACRRSPVLGLRAFSSTIPHSLPVAERELFVQSILSGDAGLAGLEDVHIPEAAKDGLAGSSCKAQAVHLKSLSHLSISTLKDASSRRPRGGLRSG
jgi:hypothetical protein